MHSFQCVSHHEIGIRMLARTFCNAEKLRISYSYFQFEFDQSASEPPISSDFVYQFGSGLQSNPQVLMRALYLPGSNIDKRSIIALPGVCPHHMVIVDRCCMDNGVELA